MRRQRFRWPRAAVGRSRKPAPDPEPLPEIELRNDHGIVCTCLECVARRLAVRS